MFKLNHSEIFMSDYAVTEMGGTPRTAFEYRNDFLDRGINFSDFFCPFCNIQLSARLVYMIGELSKSPHFAATRGKHLFDCDGAPITSERQKTDDIRSHYIRREMSSPEVLISRPIKREVVLIKPKNIEKLSQELVDEKRKNQNSAGLAKSKVYLLQPIVEARNSEIRKVFKIAEETKLDLTDKNNMMNKVLSDMPLKLEQETNYSKGFHTPKLIDNRHKLIYYGNGLVTKINEQLAIECDMKAQIAGVDVKFYVGIDSICSVNDTSPMSQRRLYSLIKEAYKNKIKLKWYAYGKPEVLSNQYMLTVSNFDYLYLKLDMFNK